MRRNIVGIAGIDGLPSEHGEERKVERGERNMFSTSGYGAVDPAFLRNVIVTNPDVVQGLSVAVAPKTWWGSQSTAVKAAIVIGGVGLVGALAYALMGGKKQTAVANKRRRRRACSYCGNPASSCGCATPNRKRRKVRRLKSPRAVQAALAAGMQGIVDKQGVYHLHKNRKRRKH